MRRAYWIATLACCAFGCSAARTTFMRVDSQGNMCEDPSRCVRGVPAMVKLPTHIEVKIVQTDFWKFEEGQFLIVPEATIRDVDVTEISTNKMIIVDPKRPISGTGEFGFSYNADGSGTLTTVNYKAIDETIKNSAALVSSAVKAFGLTANKDGSSNASDNLFRNTRTIAMKRFAIDSCTQAEIADFVGLYINYCSTAECQSGTNYAR